MAQEIKITYFGMIAEKTGTESEIIDKSEIQTDIRSYLSARYPGIENYSFSIAADLELTDEIDLDSVQEISILPPFAGG